MKARVFGITGLLLLAVIAVYFIGLAVPRHDYFIDRVGQIARSDYQITTTSSVVNETLRLHSTTGLKVDMRVMRPVESTERKLPVLLLVGGHITGKDAVDLVGEPSGVAFAAIDYPYEGNPTPDGTWQFIANMPHIQQTFLDAPPALALALSWIIEQPWADPQRIELVGVSLGVPFAAVAGATEKRFSRVWLMHGGGDNVRWLEHVGREHIDNPTLRRIAVRVGLLFVYGNSLDTMDWIQEIAPRPLVIVAAHDDDYVPRESQEPLVAAAKSEYIDIIWTEGLHIRPDRPAELQQLLDIVLSRVLNRDQPVQSTFGIE